MCFTKKILITQIKRKLDDVPYFKIRLHKFAVLSAFVKNLFKAVNFPLYELIVLKAFVRSTFKIIYNIEKQFLRKVVRCIKVLSTPLVYVKAIKNKTKR